MCLQPKHIPFHGEIWVMGLVRSFLMSEMHVQSSGCDKVELRLMRGLMLLFLFPMH